MSRARIDQRRCFFAALEAAVLVSLAGCDRSENPSVSGRVARHDGTPVTGATVIARSNETGKWASGTTDADGHYELGGAVAGDGIPPGDYFVVIMEERDESSPATIPAKYQHPSTSGLQLTVTEKKNDKFDIGLDPP